MLPNHFRAYAIHEVRGQKIEEVIAEGDLDNGQASFEADEKVSQVAFYDHENDGQVCLGRVLGPMGPGRIDIDFADVPEVEEPAETIIVGGVEYKKA
jgi:hypothetical protein